METDKDLNNFLLARFNKDDVLAEKLWKKDPVLKKALEQFDFAPVEELCCAWNILESYLGFKHDADEWGAIYKVEPDLSEEFEKVFAKWEQTLPSYLRLNSEDSYQHPEKTWPQMVEEREAHEKTPLGKEQLQLAFKLEVLGYLKLLLTGLDKRVIDAMSLYPACSDDDEHRKKIKEFIKEATKALAQKQPEAETAAEPEAAEEAPAEEDKDPFAGVEPETHLFDYGEEPSSSESQSSKNEKVHTMELSFEGGGGEFQFHRLNKEEAFSFKEEYGDTSPSEYLHGGDIFETTIFEGAYGPNPDDMELSYDDGSFSGSDFASEDVTLVEENAEAGSLEYSYTTNGKVFGEIHIELKENEAFDPEKLRFECVRYDLSNANRSGRIIKAVFYDGKECEIETSDSGQDVFPCLIGYFGWDSFAECPEAPIVYDPLEEMDSPDWKWLDKIF